MESAETLYAQVSQSLQMIVMENYGPFQIWDLSVSSELGPSKLAEIHVTEACVYCYTYICVSCINSL